MDQRTYHGNLIATDIAQALIAEFDHGNLRAQGIRGEEAIVVQIASREGRASGGDTAVSVHLSPVEDGVLVKVGQQQWLGVAASLGLTALAALKNPLTLLGRLDDVAQDILSLQVTERVWQSIDRLAQAQGASLEISERLRRLVCPYCLTANLVGAPHCIACGAPLGPQQPLACGRCGFVVEAGAAVCPNCGSAIRRA
ncbi:MAG: hypothetical protein A2Y93_01365 [Chloroflexi bacterium RBG_13_68_17]|nr:MAG: hypothetical protein A2Y93_01365 [Chloroflexi bacterium RBG_13_68_17]